MVAKLFRNYNPSIQWGDEMWGFLKAVGLQRTDFERRLRHGFTSIDNTMMRYHPGTV